MNTIERLGLGIIAIAGITAAIGAPVPSLDRLSLDDIAIVTDVDGAKDLSYSGFVHGKVRHLESRHGLGSNQLADQVTEAVEEIGCEHAGTVSGHPFPEDANDRSGTIIAEQFACGVFYIEIGWTTDEPGVDLVIGTGSRTLAGG